MHYLLKFCFILFGFTISVSAQAVICPWINKTGNDFLNPGHASDKSVNLSRLQVQEDLSCLQIILSQYYAYHITYPNNEILSRLEAAMTSAKPLSNVELLNQIFSFHDGATDLHLSYQTAGIRKHFEPQNGATVKLSEELNEDQVYERPHYTYFKPGKLLPDLTAGQSTFIEYVTKNDRPLVIDLRGNRGGDNTFAFSLVDVLFAKDQQVPGSTVTQIAGGLAYIGRCVSVSIIYGVNDGCSQVKQLFGNLPFDQLLSKSLEVESLNYVGKRQGRYTSPIFLITDSLCASACETIVEKVSALPNVKTIGTHTGGALHFSNAMSFILPNSSIWVAIPSRAETYQNQAAEGIGYVPNIETSYVDLNTLFEKF